MAKKDTKTMSAEDISAINSLIETNVAGRKPLDHRIDCVFYVMVKNANPNGDPLADNEPRTDDVGGFITDVCIKRWLRNMLEATGQKIFVSNNRIEEVDMDNLEVELKNQEPVKKMMAAAKKLYDAKLFKRWACSEYLDVRLFGHVFSYFDENVSVAGPVTITEATSVSPVYPQAIQITKSVAGADTDKVGTDTMGMKYVVPFAMYKVFLSIGGIDIAKTGLTHEDAEAVKTALTNLFEVNKSAAKPAGSMVISDIYWFEHNSLFPNINPACVNESINMRLKDGVETPSCYEDYEFDNKYIGVEPEHYNYRTGWSK